MFVYIQSLLIIVLEAFCCKIFFEIFGKKRSYHSIWVNYAVIIIFTLIVYLSAMFLSDFFIMKQILVIILMAILMYFYLNISKKKALILSILFQGLLLAVDYFAVLIYNWIFSVNGVVEKPRLVEGALVVLLGKTLLFLCVLIIKNYIGKKSAEMLVDTELQRFIFFPVFTICTITGMIATSGNLENNRQSDLFFVIAFGLAGMNIVVFYLINDILDREMTIRENKIFEMQVRNQTDMYRSISENFDKQKKKTHEFKNHILCIDFLIRKKNYEELETYVNQISSTLNMELDSINTNHPIINAILNTKYQEALEKNVIFVFRLNDLSQICISDEDIVVILSNLLNNAIEACEACKGKRRIILKFVKEEEGIILSVKNTYERSVVYENGTIQTTKELDREEHGIGVENIKAAIEKYNGSYIIRDTEKEFYFSILIPQ